MNQRSFYYTSTITNRNGEPETYVYRGGYASETKNNRTQYYVMSNQDEGRFIPATQSEYENAKTQLNSTINENVLPYFRFATMFPSLTAIRNGMGVPQLQLRPETDIERLQRENSELKRQLQQVHSFMSLNRP